MPISSLRIVSYNIQVLSQGKQGVIETLSRLAPDLIALQEVDHETARSDGVAQAALLAEALKMQAVYAAAMPYDGGEFGLAILCRGALDQLRIERLPRGGQEEPRIACFATCRLDGLSVRFANTHLAADWRAQHPERVRAQQAEALLKVLLAEAADDALPLFLAGDFNCDSGSDAMAHLQQGVRRLHQDLKTHPSIEPQEALDHIFYVPSPAGSRYAVLVTSARVDDSLASDHRPLVVDVDIELDPG